MDEDYVDDDVDLDEEGEVDGDGERRGRNSVSVLLPYSWFSFVFPCGL